MSGRYGLSQIDSIGAFLKFFFLVAVLVVGTMLIGWLNQPGGDGVSIYTDKATGCQYLVTLNGITPRMQSNGLQICVGGKYGQE